MKLLWSLNSKLGIEAWNYNMRSATIQHEGINKSLPLVYENTEFFDVLSGVVSIGHAFSKKQQVDLINHN